MSITYYNISTIAYVNVVLWNKNIACAIMIVYVVVTAVFVSMSFCILIILVLIIYILMHMIVPEYLEHR